MSTWSWVGIGAYVAIAAMMFGLNWQGGLNVIDGAKKKGVTVPASASRRAFRGAVLVGLFWPLAILGGIGMRLGRTK